jgi:uncharacterized protein YkwD
MSRTCRRALSAVVVVLALLAQVLVLGGTAQAAAANLSPYEAAVVDMTNAARAQAGLPALTARPGLVDVARGWVGAMSTSGTLSHNPALGQQLESSGASAWTSAAENVGVGGAASGVFTAYMNSPAHRDNILRNTADSIGVGAVRTPDGRVWDVMVFTNGYDDGYGAPRTAPAAIAADGSPVANTPRFSGGSPIGSVAAGKVTGPGQVSVSGWALDPDTGSSIPVHVYVGSSGVPVTADGSRPDVARVYPAYGDRHGFSATVSGVAAGVYPVCSYAINTGIGGTTLLGCTTVGLGGSPIGSVDAVKVTGPGQVSVSGWALDPDTGSSIPVHVYVGSSGVPVTADGSRPDVGKVYSGFGDNHGFSATVSGVAAGAYPVCSYAINTGAGGTRLLGCTTVGLGGSPLGWLESATVAGTSVVLTGWALDPDSAASIPIHVYVDGVGTAYSSGTSRPDVGRTYPGFGDAHGFTLTQPLSPGTHQVCVFAIDVAGAGTNRLMSCVSVRR